MPPMAAADLVAWLVGCSPPTPLEVHAGKCFLTMTLGRALQTISVARVGPWPASLQSRNQNAIVACGRPPHSFSQHILWIYSSKGT